MDFTTSNTSLLLEKSIDCLWTKQQTIINNITNAETPNYKTQYVTFEDALRDRISGANQSTSSIREEIENTQPVINEAEETTRADGNGVDITEQGLEMSRNAYQLQYVMKALSSDYSMLKTAIG